MTQVTQAREFSTSTVLNTDAYLLAQALEPVQAELKQLRPLLLKLLNVEGECAHEVLQHVFQASGKLIRPALFLLSCRLLRYNGPHKLKIAGVCEYVHTASLLHDDVVDQSTLRRNKPSTNSIWGDEEAVLVGDLIYSSASEVMASTGHLEMVQVFASAIRAMSSGELLQLRQTYCFDTSKESYFSILGGKTAVLMGASCRAAGILAESRGVEKDALEAFGYALGIAFQLVDDALDYMGNEGSLGKRVLKDLEEGKMTMPLILLRDELENEALHSFKVAFTKTPQHPESIEHISRLVWAHDTPKKTIALAQSYTQSALNSLQNSFPDSPERGDLESLAKRLMGRLA